MLPSKPIIHLVSTIPHKFVYNVKTSEAHSRMRAMLKNIAQPSNLALKVSVAKRGCSGLTHKIDIVAPNEKDEVVTIKGSLVNDALLSYKT